MTPQPELDASQRAVLDVPVGASAAVLGAPGSGKTRTAVELVAHRVLRQGFAPEQVLVLAPRRLQAGRLRDRLVLRLGVPVSRPLARTAASLAFDVARRSALAEGRPQPGLLTGAEQDAQLAALLADSPVAWPDPLAPAVRGLPAFRAELRDLLDRAVAHGQGPDELAETARRHRRPAWAAAAELWREWLDVRGWEAPDAFDAAELAALAAAAIDRGTGGAVVDALRLVVVDDVQDAGESTVALLSALAARGVAVIGLGDPDVAADTFRGGEPDLLGRFGLRLGVPVQRLVLSTVHRGGAPLRRFVQRVEERIGTALAGDQRAAAADAPGGDPPLAVLAAGSGEQALAIAHLVRERRLRLGVPYSDQAVVVRSAALAEPLARALAAAGVPARAAAAGVALSADRLPRALLDAVAIGIGLAPLTPDSATALVTGPFCGLDRLALRRLRLALRVEELAGGGSRAAGELLVEALGEPGRLTGLDAPWARRAAGVARLLADLGERAATASAEELLWRVWHGSGIAEPLRDRAQGGGAGAAEADRDLDGVVALFAAAARAAERSPNDPASLFVAAQLAAVLPDDTLAPRGRRDAVRVLTPVGAAGLEFDTVVIADLQDAVWPNLRPRGSLLGAAALEPLLGGADGVVAPDRRTVLSDELRLFVLAASRARSLLALTAVADDDVAPSVLVDLAGDPVPAAQLIRRPNALRPLVGRLRRDLVADGADDGRSDAAGALARLAAAGVRAADPAHWHGLAAASTTAPVVADGEPVPVSPSTLERFEESPLDWFVDRVAGGDGALPAAIGTLLHRVLELARTPDLAELTALLEGRWHELDFEAAWQGERERRIADRMLQALARYLAWCESRGVRLLAGETRFELTEGRAQVHGTIDRIELVDGRVLVVDLKTGRSQATDAETARHAQLGLYQLAVRSGRVEGLPPRAEAAGAALLYVRSTKAQGYELKAQPAFDDQAAESMAERVREAALGMAAAEFPGPLEPETRGPDVAYRDLLVRIPEVCDV